MKKIHLNKRFRFDIYLESKQDKEKKNTTARETRGDTEIKKKNENGEKLVGIIYR